MRRILVLALLVVLASALAVPADAIVYGEPDESDHPNVGLIVAEWRRSGVKDLLCTATLVDDDVLVTAAHCFEGVGQIWVTFDPSYDADSVLLNGTYVSHPGFNQRQSDPVDLAVVLLDDPVSTAPAQLPAAGLLSEMKASRALSEETFVAVGYGYTRDTRTGAYDNIIRPGGERRAVAQSYLGLTDTWLKLSMNQATGNGGTCNGDSGGPHFLGYSDLLVSITVTGDLVCKATDVTYRLDTELARAFLGDYMALP